MIKADLTKKSDVEKVVKGMDVIIQAAAITSGAKDVVNNPVSHITDNAIINSLIFRAAHDYQIGHVVFFSCSVMYQSSSKLLKEIDFDANAEMYPKYFGGAWNKVYLEKMCEFYSMQANSKYTVIRHSNNYGPYDKFDLHKSHVFGATIAKVMSSDKHINVWGDGKEERDLLYISDLTDFVEKAINKQSNSFSLYNVGLGKSISISNLVKKIVKLSGKKLEIRYDLSKPSIKTTYALDCSKAYTELGWKPKISLDEGIKKTLEWYKLNILNE